MFRENHDDQGEDDNNAEFDHANCGGVHNFLVSKVV
jgi:hypothetical protein